MAAHRIAAAAALCIVAGVSAAPPVAAATLIHAGRVIDGVADKALTERTVVVDGGKIVAVEAGYRKPGAGDTVIDLRGSTLMPGLMDMHVHLTSEYSRNSASDSFRKNGPDVAL
ncbi:MAG: amidohydrolase family protein, partial [Gammaproteobacteria bacterium]|nr:amidohydrolase family protein [Gammaproteobacteria bacterium]